MAEINTMVSSGKQAGVRRSKKLSTRVDLTPMVDLGFLLITFFMFTTNMSKPRAMQFVNPANGDSTWMGESSVLSVFPVDHNSLFYYHGKLDEALAAGHYGFTDYSLHNGLGNIIRQKLSALDKTAAGRKECMLLIKPAPKSTYNNLVDILDEVLINDVKKYAIMEISESEKALLASKNIHI